MGSIKKLVSSATKVVDPTGTLGGLVDNVTGVTAQEAAKKAADAQAAIAQQQATIQANATATAANSAAANTATVVSGGSADASTNSGDDTVSKKRGVSITGVLGI